MLSPHLLKALKETFFASLRDPWTAWLVFILATAEYYLLGRFLQLWS